MLSITPQRHLRMGDEPDTPALQASTQKRLSDAFAQGPGHGLLQLGAGEIGAALPPVWGWWRAVAARYVSSLCALAPGAQIEVPRPSPAQLDEWLLNLPPMPGAEYLNGELLLDLWQQLDTALKRELAAAGTGLSGFLRARHSGWHQVGRVHFNLAENRKDPETPFAFLATYTTGLASHGQAQHVPLSRALADATTRQQRSQLLTLLEPIQRAAQKCQWLAQMYSQEEIFHPMRWTARQAWQFLKDVPQLEAAGLIVRMPVTWSVGRPARARASASVGSKAPSVLGMDALLDFKLEFTLDGENLDLGDIRAMLRAGEGLHWLRGRWVEVDEQRLKRMVKRFEEIDQLASKGGIAFAEAQRLLSSADFESNDPNTEPDWAEVTAGPWLAQTLGNLRQPQGLAQVDPRPELQAELRGYQQLGVRWLYLLTRLRLGACLADDMGLGKTIQVLALLLLLKRDRQAVEKAKQGAGSRTSLLVAPASLLANWHSEAQRFAPSLRLLVLHSSMLNGVELRDLALDTVADVDLVITSYSMLTRMTLLQQVQWRLVVADEAQALKNPAARQTQAIKKLKSDGRIALTGTPVENRLLDLWSIFDFTHPGLLGNVKAFTGFTKQLAERQQYAPLRRLVQPYILRRLKGDKAVIQDLPDKAEAKAWCGLSARQAALYEQAVADLAKALAEVTGIQRKGLVLSYLMRFKQICNHPSQWLGDGEWAAEHSGKFARLRELGEVIAARQEKLLVFTQFRETTAPLAAFLGEVFGRAGLVLHGGTPVAKRRELVHQFQTDEVTPFFILSLKAGGAGLNLTAAAHVVHFDRWWNPAVENQATDRAYRIGQKKNVMVHKFVCSGTVEERIDQMIESKQQLVGDVLEEGAEQRLTELSDGELLDLVKLDIHAAMES